MSVYLGSKKVSITGGIKNTTSSISLQSKTITPSESIQIVKADSGYNGLSNVTINAISSTYVGSDVAQNDSNDLIVNGATVTVPSGYYAENAAKSVATATLATPTISVSTGGLITATENQTVSGYISIGSKSSTQQLTTKDAATYTPSTVDQTISSGQYLTGTQTIKGDANLVSSNIISGVSIFGVNGSVEVQRYYTGSADPDSSLGNDGDLYLKVGA